nr:TetR/AcrR family transcriptional regulator [Promicromonospora thailandica]
MTETLPQKLRSDAQDNRDRIVEAARELFAERGLEVTMRQVARRAGVGPATLYRRFPARQVLLEAVFADEARACRAIVEDGCADPDPWRGFCSVIEGVTVLNVGNQGFVDAFLAGGVAGGDYFVRHRAALITQMAGLVRRAQAAGKLRADFVIDDLLLVLLAGRGLAATPAARGSPRPAASPRWLSRRSGPPATTGLCRPGPRSRPRCWVRGRPHR